MSARGRNSAALALALLLLVPAPLGAGFRNLLLHLDRAVYVRGDDAAITLTTTWQGAPIRLRVWVNVHPPAPALGVSQRWLVRTDATGRAVMPLIFLPEDFLGTWVVEAFLLDTLPDGTGDGDAQTVVVF